MAPKVSAPLRRRTRPWLIWVTLLGVMLFVIGSMTFLFGDSRTETVIRTGIPSGGNTGKRVSPIEDDENHDQRQNLPLHAMEIAAAVAKAKNKIAVDNAQEQQGGGFGAIVKKIAESINHLHSPYEPLYPGTGVQALLPDDSGDQAATTCYTHNYTNLVFQDWPRGKGKNKIAIDEKGDLQIPNPVQSFFSTRTCHVLPRSFIALLQFWLEEVQIPANRDGRSDKGPIVYDRYIGGIADRLKGMYNAFLIAVVTRRPFVIRYTPRSSLPFDESFVPLLSNFRVTSSGCPLSTIDRDSPPPHQVYADCSGARTVSSNVQWIDTLMKSGLSETMKNLKRNYGDVEDHLKKSLPVFISELKTKYGDDPKVDDLAPIRWRTGSENTLESNQDDTSSWKTLQGGGDEKATVKFWQQFESEIGPMKGVRLTYLSACMFDSLFQPTPETVDILRFRASKLLPPGSSHGKCVQRKPLMCMQIRFGKTNDYVDPQYVNDNGNEQLAEFLQQQLQALEGDLVKQGVTNARIAPNPAMPTSLPVDKLLEPHPRPPYFFQTIPQEHAFDAVDTGNPSKPAPFCLFITADVADFQMKMNTTIHKHFSHMFDPSCSMVDIKGSVHIAKSRGIEGRVMSTLGADFLFLRYCTKTMVTGDSGFGGLALGLKARRDAIENDYFGMHRDPSPAYFRRYYQNDGSKW